MAKVKDCFSVFEKTVLVLDEPLPYHWKGGISIDGVAYDTMVVYDIKNATAICASGDFLGKEVIFTY